MGHGLRWKRKEDQVRMIIGEGKYLAGMDHVKDNERREFIVIGPLPEPEGEGFERLYSAGFFLERACNFICRGFNLESREGRRRRKKSNE